MSRTTIELLEAVQPSYHEKFGRFFSPQRPTLIIVNFSSLHDEGRLDDALHQFHSIELVIALRNGRIMVDLAIHSSLGGN
jgi:hypothetical protein